MVWSGPEAGRPPRAHWRGSGGRWLVWAGRAVIWAVILVIGYRGVLAIVTGPAPAARLPAPPPARVAARPAARRPAAQFPSAAAEAFALEFGNVYLNFSPATATTRSAALAAFLPAGADPQLGWNGAGSQTLADEQVAGITVAGAHDAVVALLARLGSGSLIELGVPVYAAGAAMTVSGQPALLPGPAKAAVPAASQAQGDAAAEAALRTQLAGFFPAYAASDTETLDRFLAPGTRLAGLGGAVRFGGIDEVFAPAGGARRVVAVTVTWQLPGLAGQAAQSGPAGLLMTYQLAVVRRDGNWDISSVSAAANGLP